MSNCKYVSLREGVRYNCSIIPKEGEYCAKHKALVPQAQIYDCEYPGCTLASKALSRMCIFHAPIVYRKNKRHERYEAEKQKRKNNAQPEPEPEPEPEPQPEPQPSTTVAKIVSEIEKKEEQAAPVKRKPRAKKVQLEEPPKEEPQKEELPEPQVKKVVRRRKPTSSQNDGPLMEVSVPA